MTSPFVTVLLLGTIWILVILVLLAPRTTENSRKPADAIASPLRRRMSIHTKRRVKAIALICVVVILSCLGVQQAFFSTRHLYLAGSIYDGPTYELGDLKYYESQKESFGFIGTPFSGADECWSAESYTGLTEYNNRETVYLTKSQTAKAWFKTYYTPQDKPAVIDITYRSWLFGLYNQAVTVSVVKGSAGQCPGETAY